MEEGEWQANDVGSPQGSDYSNEESRSGPPCAHGIDQLCAGDVTKRSYPRVEPPPATGS